MKIEVFCLAHQEEKILPYFMKHYTQFADVTLMEGHSTDRTVEIAESYGAKIWKVDSNNEVNDDIWTNLKNNCWKESKADWVIICDADEFVWHPNLPKFLEETDFTILLPRLFNMFSDEFPTTTGQIYDEVKHGKEGGAKMNIFRPSEIEEINYSVGCHYARPVGNVKLGVTSEVLTLHMRHLSAQYVIDKNAYLFKRLSEVNKSRGWGYHLGSTPEEVRKYMHNEMTQLIKCVP